MDLVYWSVLGRSGADLYRPGNADEAPVIGSVLDATVGSDLKYGREVIQAMCQWRRETTMNSPCKLSHENLDVYQAAIEFLVLASTLLERLPRGYGPIADQLRRAALSIPLNIAEGYGKRSRNDRSRFYDIARGSAHECGAILDAGRILRLVDDSTYGRGKTLLHRIVAMLVRMTA